jgi:predicted amidohydrolase YtcJ
MSAQRHSSSFCIRTLVRKLPPADLILTGGRIWTGRSSQPAAEAIAIGGDTIVRVGRSADVLELRTPRTTLRDLGGRRVVPGFNDAHVHFSTGGLALATPELREANSEQEFREMLGRIAALRSAGEWITEPCWDCEKWDVARLPTHELIDGVTPENPVCINRIDLHTSLANGLAMKLAGVGRDTHDVPGGVIVRNLDGTPTGIFKDAAQTLIRHAVPPPTTQNLVHALVAAQRYAARHGVTSVHDMGIVGADHRTVVALMDAYRSLENAGGLKVKVSLHVPLRDWSGLAQVERTRGRTFQIGGLKAFADGSLGSHTAWFEEPYSDSSDTCGLPSEELADPATMYAKIKGADAAGLQVAIHAIGDRAVSAILDFFEHLHAENGDRDRRARIEHAQHVRASDFARFRGADVIASMQPYHYVDEASWMEGRIGANRVAQAYPLRSLADAGARLALGSDWPVGSIEPMRVIHAALSRAEQALTLDEALRFYTMGSAYAAFDELRVGSLEPGKLANLVALSDDIFAIEPAAISDVKVDLTVFGGEVVYERAPVTCS